MVERNISECTGKQVAGGIMNSSNIRKDFPILNRKINGYPLAYLDNAATTQKPVQVINAIKDYYENSNANIHRSVHKLSEEATELYESSRDVTAKFIGANQEEIIFTRNATDVINLVMYSYGDQLKAGDEILLTIMEHHSNIVPWQQLQSKGIKLRYVDINDDGTLNMDQLRDNATKNTKLIAVTHCSNILGTINPIKEISNIAHDAGALCLVDGAQSVPHMTVNIKELGCDFLAFSGHKMLGPMGIGALWGRKEILDNMKPFIYGGDMIKEVDTHNTTFNDVPWKFEAGTPNVSGAVGLAAAIKYLDKIGMHNIREHSKMLADYALENMPAEALIYGSGSRSKNNSGIISFNLGDMHSHDVASVLNDYGIAIRSGHGCAMPLMKRLSVDSVCRASFYLYNTREEVDRFIQALNEAKRIFRIDE